MKVITLANLAESTSQEVFEHVCRHLLTQLKRSRDIDGKCKYHLVIKEGNKDIVLKCAAGCLISDKEYQRFKQNPEFLDWSDLIEFRIVKEKKHQGLIRELQRIHDDYSLVPTEDWKPILIKTGKWYELDTSFIEREF